MNKEQIIKRMNPEQLAKLNGPKTEVADNIKHYPLTPDEMSESIEAKQARGVVTIDMAEMPDDTTAEEFITQRVESAKLEFIDFHQTPPEFIEGEVVHSGFVQVVVDNTPLPEVTYTSTTANGPAVSLPRTKKKKHRR